MRKNIAFKLILILFLSSIQLSAQIEISKLNLAAYDLVYDGITDRIFVSLLSENGTNGNSLGIINPHTAVLEETVFIGSEPTVLAISGDGHYIYSGFAGSSSIRRFHVAERQAGIQFSLGYDFFSGPYFAEDIEVMPGSNSTIAVSRFDRNNHHGGVVIFDDDIMRPVKTYQGIINVIEFRDSANLIGYNYTTTEFGLRYLRVDQSGVTELSVAQNVLTSYASDFVYHNNRIFANDGTAAFVAGFPFKIGKFSGARGQVVYDKNSDYVCYANFRAENDIEFVRYFPDDFRMLDKYSIPNATGYPYNIITCGHGCYAFNTTDYQVFILRLPSLGYKEQAIDFRFKLYPNPVTDFMKIITSEEVIDVQIIDLSGRLVGRHSAPNQMIDFRNIASGTYMLRITDQTGCVYYQKVIRK